MFVWAVLKRGIPESVQFCIGDLPMYIILYRPIPSIKYLGYSNFKKRYPYL